MILKLKRTPGIWLVGFMGSGKSTVGRALARSLGWRFADLDEDIESHERMTIAEIFEGKGEAEFRNLEHEALRRRVQDVARGVPWVVALGGGVFAQERNVDLICNHGVSIWLNAPLELLKSRVAHGTHRPLARDLGKFEELYHTRQPCYEKAEYHIPIGPGGSQAAVEEILKLPIF
jgi:shikimate kinase